MILLWTCFAHSDTTPTSLCFPGQKSYPFLHAGYDRHFIYVSVLCQSFFFFWTTPVAYGSSKARGPIGAAAMWDLSCVCDLHHKLMARLDP